MTPPCVFSVSSAQTRPRVFLSWMPHLQWVGRSVLNVLDDHGNCSVSFRYNASLRNLSTLQQMGSDTEVRNYVTVTTGVLGRWARERGSPSCGQWSRIQDAFISSICRLAPQDQVWPRVSVGLSVQQGLRLVSLLASGSAVRYHQS